MMKTLTAKAIRLAVKRHTTCSELKEDYGFSSDEELFQAIRRIFTQPQESNRIISDIQKNSKRANTSSSAEHVSQKSLDVQSDESITPVSIPESCANEESLTPDLLTSLRAEEEELSAKLISLENTHKSLVANHLISKKNLQRMQKILDEMQRLISEHQKNLGNELEKIMNTSDEMAKVSREIKTISHHLKEVRAQIEEHTKIAIFVYANGNLEIENGEIPFAVSSNEIVTSKFMELIQCPRAKDFSVTLKELTTVAKLLLWTEYLASSGLAFDISFDSEEVQRFYEAVTASTNTTA